MKHLLIVPGQLKESDPIFRDTGFINPAADRTEALKLGKEMALHHGGEVHVYELVKILKPVTTVELNDPPADARPPHSRAVLEKKQELNELDLVKGVMYKWKGQAEILDYLGKKGQWHQFALIGATAVWCEVLDTDLHMLEVYTFPPAPCGGKIPAPRNLEKR